MDSLNSLKHHFLIAMPKMDGFFTQTLVYICDHDKTGTMGLVVNLPSQLAMQDVFEQLGHETYSPLWAHQKVLAGGPVSTEQGFILHRSSSSPWQTTEHVGDDVYLTVSSDIIHAMAEEKFDDPALLILGYAGWDGGQLEREIANDGWLVCEADSNIIFHNNMQAKLDLAAAQLGVDMHAVNQQTQQYKH